MGVGVGGDGMGGGDGPHKKYQFYYGLKNFKTKG